MYFNFSQFSSKKNYGNNIHFFREITGETPGQIQLGVMANISFLGSSKTDQRPPQGHLKKRPVFRKGIFNTNLPRKVLVC